jgi:peptidoglycan/xylan/chitin deacetylase (PgdA/CDA1 family)
MRSPILDRSQSHRVRSRHYGPFEIRPRRDPLVGGAETIVLCYHRVAEPAFDPYRLCVSPANFSAQLQMLARRAEPATLDEALVPSRHPRFVITFDDGYADNAAIAHPIAVAAGIPITVYVTSGRIGERDGFWWDRLAHILAQATGTTITASAVIGGAASLQTPHDVEHTRQVVHTALRWRPPRQIDAMLEALAAELGVEPSVPREARPMTGAELVELAAGSSRAIVGAHTVAHELLRGSSYNDQLATMRTSRTALEALIGQPVRHFAYPFGGADSFDALSVLATGGAGFTTAATTLHGLVDRSACHLTLRRRLVMDWTPRRFALQLARWGFG